MSGAWQQSLLAGIQGFGESRAQSRRQPCAALGRRLAQIDGFDTRQPRGAVAIRQQRAAVAASFDIDDRLQRRRGRHQHGGAALQARAHDRQVAGVINDAILLLEGGVVLLIDHDQAERAKGQPQSGPCADHDPRPALGDGAPGLAAPSRAELRVPDRRIDPEARAKAREPLGAQRDLGQHHQHLIAGIERGSDSLEIDLRLAGAGHAVEHGDREVAGGNRLT